MKRFLLVLALLAAGGCSSAYYGTMEKLGVHKREIMVDRVEEARDSQRAAEKQFSSALEQFKAVVRVEESGLQRTYDKLQGEYDRSREAAEAIHEQIGDLESVAEALFKEWEAELKQYSNEQLRSESRRKLAATKTKYRELVRAMRQTESRLKPVLAAMQDQVLYLKHNLNARAIQALKPEVAKIDRDVDVLLVAIRQAVAEADSFIKEMRQ